VYLSPPVTQPDRQEAELLQRLCESRAPQEQFFGVISADTVASNRQSLNDSV
jgi:hypothetical protein